MKAIYALISVNNGKVKQRNNNLDYIDNIKHLDLLTFKTKKQANEYIKTHLAWALRPIKVVENTYRVNDKVQHYSFY